MLTFHWTTICIRRSLLVFGISLGFFQCIKDAWDTCELYAYPLERMEKYVLSVSRPNGEQTDSCWVARQIPSTEKQCSIWLTGCVEWKGS